MYCTADRSAKRFRKVVNRTKQSKSSINNFCAHLLCRRLVAELNKAWALFDGMLYISAIWLAA